jgi:hypothetical protein
MPKIAVMVSAGSDSISVDMETDRRLDYSYQERTRD